MEFDEDIFDKFEKAEYIPKNVGRKDNIIRKKVIYFLKGFMVGEIQTLKFNDKQQRYFYISRIRYYATSLLPMKFRIYARTEDDKYAIYIQRMKTDDEAEPVVVNPTLTDIPGRTEK